MIECKFCDYKGEYRSALKDYTKPVHKDIQYKCDTCEKHLWIKGTIRLNKLS